MLSGVILAAAVAATLKAKHSRLAYAGSVTQLSLQATLRQKHIVFA